MIFQWYVALNPYTEVKFEAMIFLMNKTFPSYRDVMAQAHEPHPAHGVQKFRNNQGGVDAMF